MSNESAQNGCVRNNIWSSEGCDAGFYGRWWAQSLPHNVTLAAFETRLRRSYALLRKGQ